MKPSRRQEKAKSGKVSSPSKIGQKMDVVLGKTLAEQISPRWRPLWRISEVFGYIFFALVFVVFATDTVRELIDKPTSLERWIIAALIALWGYKLLFQPLGRGLRALRREGRPRTRQTCALPDEGLVLRRMFSREILFLLVWCLGWNIVAFGFMPPEFMAAVRDYPTKGFQMILVVGVVFPLIGLAVTGILIRKIIQRCQPTYEIRLLGGVVRENGVLAVDYRFLGNPEKVKSAEFILASANRIFVSGRVTDEPGMSDDGVRFDTLAACTAGRHTFKLPEIRSDCHDVFDYYLHTIVTFKSELKAKSAYRIPLR